MFKKYGNKGDGLDRGFISILLSPFCWVIETYIYIYIYISSEASNYFVEAIVITESKL